MRKIGIYAGVFDPIHDGHIEVARMALELLELDELNFMVEQVPWGNKSPIDVKYRREMVSLAVNKLTHAKLFTARQVRFDVSKTLSEIEAKFPSDQLFFVFGADTFMKMNEKQWPELDKLTKHNIVVFERGTYSETEISKHARSLGLALAILPSPHPEHSSTDVRFSKDKHLWLPDYIAEYIKENELY